MMPMDNQLDELFKLRTIHKLKAVERFAHVGTSKKQRHESPAEHTWSALIIADYLLATTRNNLNNQQVFNLILYHDLPELLIGDIPRTPNEDLKEKQQREHEATKRTSFILPPILSPRVKQLLEEYERQETPESQYAKLVDYLDADIHDLDYPEDWKGWTLEYYKKIRGKDVERQLKNFPELKKVFEELTAYLVKEKYLET